MKKDIQFVLQGKTYNSIQRAEKRKKDLINSGYKILSENSKKITFIKK